MFFTNRRSRPGTCRRLLTPLLLVVTTVAGCGDQDGPGVAFERAPIIAGTLSFDDRAVVALRAADHRPLCTGTLIAPSLVLTAAHCVRSSDPARRVVDVFDGMDVTGPGTAVRVLASRVSPKNDGFSREGDVAVLRLADPLDGPPVDLVSDPQADLLNLRLVGFGVDEEGTKGVRRSASAEPVALIEDGLALRGGACFVDSGGPVLVRDLQGLERVGAVISSGNWECTTARATRTAPHADWINDQLHELDHPSCRPDGLCGDGCPFGDADCPCAADGRCQRCAGEDPDCAPSCGSDNVCATACLAPDPDCGRQREGDPCGHPAECAIGACSDGVCRQTCELTGASTCPPWLRCAAAPASPSGVCLPPRNQPGCQTAPGPATRASAAGVLLTVALLLHWTSRRFSLFATTQRNRNQGKGTRT